MGPCWLQFPIFSHCGPFLCCVWFSLDNVCLRRPPLCSKLPLRLPWFQRPLGSDLPSRAKAEPPESGPINGVQGPTSLHGRPLADTGGVLKKPSCGVEEGVRKPTMSFDDVLEAGPRCKFRASAMLFWYGLPSEVACRSGGTEFPQLTA